MGIYGAPETQVLNSGFGGFGGGFGGSYPYPMPYPIPSYGGCGYGGGYGGGFGGFGCGGILEGLVLGGLVGGRGGLFGRDGHGEHCGKCNADCHDVLELMEKLGDVDKDIYQSANSTQKDICGLKDNFAATNAAIANVNYNQVINTKDIIHDIDVQSCNLGSKIDKSTCETNHNIDNKSFMLSKQLSDCCCELQKEGLKNTQVILDRMCANEKAFLQRELDEEREKRHRMERENDLFRFNGAVSANIASFRAATAGSNFNTGTQTQSTSNNSGQQIGA